MKTLSIDIETFSSENLTKCGVYRYAEAPDFEVLLFGYSADGAPVQVVDLTAGETLPADVRSALTDPAVTKWAFNAQFERVCLSRYLGYPTGQYLDPSSWHCTMVWAATLGLPLSLEGVGAVLGLEKQKLKEGKDLIRYFCTPAKARDGSPIRRAKMRPDREPLRPNHRKVRPLPRGKPSDRRHFVSERGRISEKPCITKPPSRFSVRGGSFMMQLVI